MSHSSESNQEACDEGSPEVWCWKGNFNSDQELVQTFTWGQEASEEGCAKEEGSSQEGRAKEDSYPQGEDRPEKEVSAEEEDDPQGEIRSQEEDHNQGKDIVSHVGWENFIVCTCRSWRLLISSFELTTRRPFTFEGYYINNIFLVSVLDVSNIIVFLFALFFCWL